MQNEKEKIVVEEEKKNELMDHSEEKNVLPKRNRRKISNSDKEEEEDNEMTSNIAAKKLPPKKKIKNMHDIWNGKPWKTLLYEFSQQGDWTCKGCFQKKDSEFVFCCCFDQKIENYPKGFPKKTFCNRN